MTSMWSSPERRTERCAGSDAARPARPSRADGCGDRRDRTLGRGPARTPARVTARLAATV